MYAFEWFDYRRTDGIVDREGLGADTRATNGLHCKTELSLSLPNPTNVSDVGVHILSNSSTPAQGNGDSTWHANNFLECLPGMRRVLLADSHLPGPFGVPVGVSGAVGNPAVEAAATAVPPGLHLLFRLSATLEADGSALSAVVGLFSGLAIVLRSAFLGLPAETRIFLAHCTCCRLGKWYHPVVVFSFFGIFSFPCADDWRVTSAGGTTLW